MNVHERPRLQRPSLAGCSHNWALFLAYWQGALDALVRAMIDPQFQYGRIYSLLHYDTCLLCRTDREAVQGVQNRKLSKSAFDMCMMAHLADIICGCHARWN
jgi:hypothetical protein